MNPDGAQNPKKSFVVFDLETTGLKPEEGHEILEIGAEKLIDREVVDYFHTLVKATKPIPEESMKIHGITEEAVAVNGKELADAIPEFLRFIEGSVLVGHNVGFDLSFLFAACRKIGVPEPRNQSLDTCEISRRLLIIPSYSLGRVAQYFGVVNEQAHRAQSDVEVTRKVFLKLLDRALSSKTQSS
ncbi:MAG: hypothetical protein COT25_00975 [Candidatus Kerfeldbacteria bacterium CG08_land_8_20_14_0_20_42_7]|uniref:Exonuclease domain-containing protein n=1 Tax=Candidatus Kerfeldbacteria bacterium CG08_land_8_20_14_0_20_42_7 TaxID=2014245 RepID=A0A2H0YTJ7_9BACT|nr:MAG: hypothetical protein COT25_00975 [Candidatus Kerfeldbacteria bacterium CG08_land_8_20_14_0_20_42_7]